MEPIAYLPLEIKQRDLDSRLLIAAHLLRSGIRVVVGQQWALFANADAVPRGVVFFKTANDIQARNMARFRSVGHVVAANDEEALAICGEGAYTSSIGVLAAENCDLFFAQNLEHRTVLEERFPLLKGRIEVAGSPRLDLLAPPLRAPLNAQAGRLVAETGPYVLFNLNYGQINTIWGDVNRLIRIAMTAGIIDRDDPKSLELFRAELEWEKGNFKEMLHLLRWAAASIRGCKLVIRPHPVEQVDFWRQEFGKADQVMIVEKSNPYPWSLGALLTAHTQCTTGLEAALLGVPTANLAPAPNPRLQFLMGKVNPTFGKWEDAARAMAAYLRTRTGPLTEEKEKHAQALAETFPDWDKAQAAVRMADGLRRLLGAGRNVGSGIKPEQGFGGFQKQEMSETSRRKFTLPVEEFLTRFQEIAGLVQLSGNVNVTPLDESLFLLVPT